MEALRYPIATEKAIRLIESDNTITFVVDTRASKTIIKKEIESKFKVKVDRIKTMLSPKGIKRAYVRLSADTPAIDIATQLGLM